MSRRYRNDFCDAGGHGEPVGAGAGRLRCVQGRKDHPPGAGLCQDRRGDEGHRLQDPRYHPPAGTADPPHAHDSRRHRPGSLQGKTSYRNFCSIYIHQFACSLLLLK
uniref:Uncharacterized protein n=1 Tax=Arundo donax TaxID=35708 RepID=A0A0A9G0C9_ARUDO